VLLVDVRTDYAPGIEFSAVQSEVTGAGAPTVQAAFRGDDYLSGARVADIAVDAGSRELRVSLLGADRRDVLAERVVRVEVDGRTAVTVTVGRGPEVECATAAECTVAVPCAEPVCVEGVCFAASRDDDDACGIEEWCNPDVGCEPLPAPDAGMPVEDGGGRDAGPVDGGPVDGGPRDGGPPDTGPPDAAPPDAPLLAYYPCDTVTGGGLPDASGRGHHGFCVPTQCPTPRMTMWGFACDFDGNDYVRIPGRADFESTDFTIVLWARPDALEGALFGKVLEAGPVNSWQVAQEIGGDRWAFVTSVGGGAPNVPLYASTPIATGVWTHVAVVYEGGQKRLYVNAVEEAAAAGSIAYTGGEVLLGADWSAASGNELYFDGLIAGVRFYGGALSVGEIRSVAGL
jgi:hypothetical protein